MNPVVQPAVNAPVPGIPVDMLSRPPQSNSNVHAHFIHDHRDRNIFVQERLSSLLVEAKELSKCANLDVFVRVTRPDGGGTFTHVSPALRAEGYAGQPLPIIPPQANAQQPMLLNNPQAVIAPRLPGTVIDFLSRFNVPNQVLLAVELAILHYNGDTSALRTELESLRFPRAVSISLEVLILRHLEYVQESS